MTDRPVRGIRQSIPPGTVLARLNGVGPPQPISLAELTNAIVRTGKVATGSGSSSSFITAVGPFLTVVAGTLDLETSATQLRTVVFPVVGRLLSAQKYSVVVTQPGTFLANGGAPEAYVPTLPAANLTLGLNTIHGGVTTALGTVAVNTGGTVTFPAFAAVPMVAGDVIQMTAPLLTDSLFADPSFSYQYAVSEAVATPTTEEWLAGTVTAVGTGMAITAGTISATGVQEWTAGTVSAIGTGVTVTAGTISAAGGAAQWTAGTVSAIGTGITLTAGTISAAGGGGGGVPITIVEGGTTAATVGSNTSDVIVPGLTVTVTAAASSALAWVDWFAIQQAGTQGHNMRWSIYLDGTIAFPKGVSAMNQVTDTNGDGAYWRGGTGVITLPGGSGTHGVDIRWQASGSTATFNIFDRAIKVTQ